MITHKGTLPVGVEVDGEFHLSFELRPQLVRDSFDVLKDASVASNDSLVGIALLKAQLVSLGTLDPEQITLDLLLGMYDIDMKELMEAQKALRDLLTNFRGKGKEVQESTATLATGGAGLAND